jgi:uncharacterized repeat protein (TIGR03803 family)
MKRREPVRFSCILFPVLILLIVPIVAAAQEKIAFTSNRDAGYQIYIMNPDGTSQTSLTNAPGENTQPAFKSSDDKIVFTSSRDGNSEIYMMNANGTGQTRLTNNVATDHYPSYSPDGSLVVFASTRDGNNEIYVMNADGSNQVRLTTTPGNELNPVFSPDGTRIAFQHNVDPDSGTDEIFIMNANGSNRTMLTDSPGSTFNNVHPRFHPDGSKIVFTSSRDGVIGNGDFEIYVMNVNGSSQTRLTTDATNELDYPTYSLDGSKIAFTTRPEINPSVGDIYVMDSDGSNAALLATEGANYGPSWGDANAKPTITAAAGVTRGRNAGPSNSLIATVDDVEDPPGTLDVTVNGGPSATVNGITISNIFVDAPGNVSADIEAVTPPCGATLAGFALRVTDNGGRFAEAILVVSTTPVPPPGALPGNAFSGVVPGPDGRLYGVTYNCGNTNDGTLYVYNPSTQFVTELHSFNGATDGSVPYEELRFDAVSGKFYGVTYGGGPSGVGTVFTFDHATHAFTPIRSDFGGYGRPEGTPVRSNNYLYGAVRNGNGAIYRMAPDGSEFEIIHAFAQTDSRPQPLTLGPDGLYGVTLGGGNSCPVVGTGCGTVFRLEAALPGEATGFDTVYEFPVTTQRPFINPVRGIIYGSDGRLYGSTFNNVFRLDPQGTNFQTIFMGGEGNTLPLIEGSNGRLYITDYFGGPDGAGSVFSIKKDGTGLATFLAFNYDTGSNGPYGRLYRNAAGTIFGTTEYDAAGGPGTVFVITQEQIFANGFEN